jgi:hypothetical protein
MADNTTLNIGTGGDIIASDDIGGVKHQRVKVEFGVDGAATEVADSDGARLPVKPQQGSTATRTQVADSATSGTILSSNANRKGGVITNDSSAILYLAYGAVAATTTNYTAKLYQDQTHEILSCYTGTIVGIWDSDPGDGGARVTELT